MQQCSTENVMSRVIAKVEAFELKCTSRTINDVTDNDYEDVLDTVQTAGDVFPTQMRDLQILAMRVDSAYDEYKFNVENYNDWVHQWSHYVREMES